MGHGARHREGVIDYPLAVRGGGPADQIVECVDAAVLVGIVLGRPHGFGQDLVPLIRAQAKLAARSLLPCARASPSVVDRGPSSVLPVWKMARARWTMAATKYSNARVASVGGTRARAH